jgi:phenylalanyl-tRNA synthetase beta chain
MDVKGPAVAFTVWPAAVPAPRKTGATRPALVIRDLQAVERDFAFVVDAAGRGVDASSMPPLGADKTLD